MYFFFKDLMDKFEEIEVMEDSLEGLDEYIENLVGIVDDSIEDVVWTMLKILLPKFYEDNYFIYLYEIEIFKFDLLCYIIFVWS